MPFGFRIVSIRYTGSWVPAADGMALRPESGRGLRCAGAGLDVGSARPKAAFNRAGRVLPAWGAAVRPDAHSLCVNERTSFIVPRHAPRADVRAWQRTPRDAERVRPGNA